MMGTSPLTGTIYYGTLDTEKSRWVGTKTDVKEMACSAVAEHLFRNDTSKTYKLSDGRELWLSVEIIESPEVNSDGLSNR